MFLTLTPKALAPPRHRRGPEWGTLTTDEFEDHVRDCLTFALDRVQPTTETIPIGVVSPPSSDPSLAAPRRLGAQLESLAAMCGYPSVSVPLSAVSQLCLLEGGGLPTSEPRSLKRRFCEALTLLRSECSTDPPRLDIAT